jgi:hypothetical protein
VITSAAPLNVGWSVSAPSCVTHLHGNRSLANTARKIHPQVVGELCAASPAATARLPRSYRCAASVRCKSPSPGLTWLGSKCVHGRLGMGRAADMRGRLRTTHPLPRPPGLVPPHRPSVDKPGQSSPFSSYPPVQAATHLYTG